MGAPAAEGTIAPASDPRAAASIRRAKSWGGLGGFGVVAAGGWLQGGAVADVALHALVAGVVAMFVAWAAAVTVWRHLLRARLRATVERALAARAGAAGER